MDAQDSDTAKLVASPSSSKPSAPARSSSNTNFRTEEIRGYLFKKTRDGKWQKRWFETNGCFLTYYKKQGQKLLAALNLPQVGAITLLQEDNSEGPGLFTIELNERVYTIKARSHDEAAFWVDALLWRQAGGVVTQKSPEVSQKVGGLSAVSADQLDSLQSAGAASTTAASTSSVSSSTHTTTATTKQKLALEEPVTGKEDELKSGGCAACCVLQ